MSGAMCEDGSWEDAVVSVIVAGDPPTILRMAQDWKTISGVIPDYGRDLEQLVATLTEGHAGWHGRAADEYEKAVTHVLNEMRVLQEDFGKIAGNLSYSESLLSAAISQIPVPLVKGSSDVFWTAHTLPGGTDMDDGKSMHDPATFIGALRRDYTDNTGAYANFKNMYTSSTWDKGGSNNASDLRSGVQKGARYEGRYDDVDAWYNTNAGIAQHHFTALRDDYTQQRSQYEFPQGVDPFKPSDDGHQAHAPDPAGSFDGTSAAGAAVGIPGSTYAGTASSGSLPSAAGYDGGHGTHLSAGTSGGDWTSGSAPSRLPGAAGPGSGLSSTGGPSGVGGLGGGGGLGSGTGPGGADGLGGGAPGGSLGGGMPGSVPGLLSPGSASSGPERYPTPPLTSPPESATGRAGPGSSAGTSARTGAGTGMGMMPHGGGRSGDGEGHQTWLTEDDDVWGSSDTPVPPSVIKGGDW